MIQYHLSDINKAVEQILTLVKNNRVILFNGEMGAGKTTLINALCKAMGSKDDTGSPTYSIVNEYESDFGKIYHFDFYRLKSIEEAFDMGVEEYFYSDAYCFIEWAERVEKLLPEDHVKVEIKILEPEVRELEWN